MLTSDPSLKRADLHCHSRYSVFKYFKRANTRDCYNAPEDVYRIAKERGMSFVTLTDHDSIDYVSLANSARLIVDTRNACARAGAEGKHIVKA